MVLEVGVEQHFLYCQGAISFSPITIVAPLSASDTTLIQALVSGQSVEQLDIGFYGKHSKSV